MFTFFKNKYKKIKSSLVSNLKRIFLRPVDESTLAELEQILYETDLGSSCVELFIHHIEEYHKKNKQASFQDYLQEMKKLGDALLSAPPKIIARSYNKEEPLVILLVGINGSGKTTSAAKLGRLYKQNKKKVLLAAGDTFRAAAVEQLELWAGKLGIDLVKGVQGADPSSVIFDALTKAKANHYDVVIGDTAGRLESKTDLMKELEKIGRVCKKVSIDAPHETYLVLDATIGQAAMEQAKIFHSFTPLSGIILTKLDGSAKGGIILSIYKELGIPIRFVGLGESEDDFEAFDKEKYLDALFSI
ncbi:MAG: signal recognition particle-docking protein FtsY [Chlamydiales bacterium]|nr:signal recognition particle-docking protein FtsY [Chlamydiales bacterium]